MLKGYNSNIDTLHTFLANELKDSIIIPVLTSNIAINSGNDDYINFANDPTASQSSTLTTSMTTELNKSKLKHSIIKNIAYSNEIKTRQDAEYYFNKISKNTEDDYRTDKIPYYLDFVNEFKLLNDVIDASDDARKSAIELKTFIVKETNNKELLKKATETYLGPTILDKYNLIDIVVCCAIIIIAILLYSVKAYVNIYISGILALMFVLMIVFITMIFI
tara:strand:- start:1840 stop:2499 length:660 start_codon:yes stop_codon:yes gene_type:complete